MSRLNAPANNYEDRLSGSSRPLSADIKWASPPFPFASSTGREYVPRSQLQGPRDTCPTTGNTNSYLGTLTFSAPPRTPKIFSNRTFVANSLPRSTDCRLDEATDRQSFTRPSYYSNPNPFCRRDTMFDPFAKLLSCVIPATPTAPPLLSRLTR